MKRRFTRARQRLSDLIGCHQETLAMDRAGSMKLALLGIRLITKKLSAACPSVEFRLQRRQFAQQVRVRWRWLR